LKIQFQLQNFEFGASRKFCFWHYKRKSFFRCYWAGSPLPACQLLRPARPPHLPRSPAHALGRPRQHALAAWMPLAVVDVRVAPLWPYTLRTRLHPHHLLTMFPLASFSLASATLASPALAAAAAAPPRHRRGSRTSPPWFLHPIHPH
jgi:hypothetical protein